MKTSEEECVSVRVQLGLKEEDLTLPKLSAPLQPAPPAPLEPINPKDSLGLTKVSLSKVPVAGIIHEALAMRDGAVKYGPHNWREYPVIATVYYDACMRHMMAWFDGEDLAPDSGVHHLGHAKACLGILLDAMENGKLGDDRPLPGAAARLFAENVQSLSPEPNDALRAAAELYQRAVDNGSLKTDAKIDCDFHPDCDTPAPFEGD